MTNKNSHSIETREKMSESNIGRKGKLGWRAPDEVRQKMSAGANRSDKHILGLDVTNQVFQDLYPEAELAGYFAHGYDFVMPDGAKIDVKGAIYSKGRWAYSIKRNTVPDYFFLMAFNDDYNLLRMWKVPCDVVSSLTGITISEGSFKRWDSYVVPIRF